MSQSLVAAVEALKKQPLKPDEVEMLAAFQKQFNLDDDDPINVVLALMAHSQMIIGTAPTLLQQKVEETIELHRTNLRTQAVLVAKELVSELAPVLIAGQNDVSALWRQRIYCFAAGAGAMLIAMAALLALARYVR